VVEVVGAVAVGFPSFQRIGDGVLQGCLFRLISGRVAPFPFIALRGGSPPTVLG
jgi:hypothetical protein